jgi:hypothetical protein
LGVPLYSWEDELSKCSAGPVCDHRDWAETYSAQLRSYPCQLDWGIRTLKKGAKFKLFKDFQFYSRFSSLLISCSYLIPTVINEQPYSCNKWKILTNLLVLDESNCKHHNLSMYQFWQFYHLNCNVYTSSYLKPFSITSKILKLLYNV